MKIWSEEDVRKFFYKCTRRLRRRKVFPAAVDCLESGYQSVVKHVIDMHIDVARYAFLPIVPRSFLSSPMNAVIMMERCMGWRIGLKQGYTFLLPELVTDLTDVPDVPYFIFDIEDGRAENGTDALGVSPGRLKRSSASKGGGDLPIWRS